MKTPPENEISLLNSKLKEVLLHHIPKAGMHASAIEGMHLLRYDTKTESQRCFEQPFIGVLIQGNKYTTIGTQNYYYTENQCLVSGLDMPSSFYAVNPTPENPFLAFSLYLDRQLITQLTTEISQHAPQAEIPCYSVYVADADADLLGAFLRLLQLLEKPEHIPVRAPIIIREIHYLLLVGPQGGNLRQLNTLGSLNNQVVQAIAWLRNNYTTPFQGDTLAHQVNMSVSNFYKHFKKLTGLSPLQYHKQLRLFEAQRLMLSENERASSAALAVGYESITQFNREYKRLFGEPPLRDMDRRRNMLL